MMKDDGDDGASHDARIVAEGVQRARDLRGNAPNPRMSNYGAQQTVAALPAAEQAAFRDAPITDHEVQQWWADWNPATMHVTPPTFVLHTKRLVPFASSLRRRDEQPAQGEWTDTHRAAPPRTRPPQRTRLVGGRPSLLFDPGSKINLI